VLLVTLPVLATTSHQQSPNMTFTYSSNLETDLSLIRLYVGDSVENAGPRPDSTNFSDEEVSALFGLAEGNVSVVVSQLFSILVAEWTKLAVSITIGPRREELWRVADMYKKRAQEWAVVAGIASSTFSSGVIRRGYYADSEHTS
jgi:hypothetical protein